MYKKKVYALKDVVPQKKSFSANAFGDKRCYEQKAIVENGAGTEKVITASLSHSRNCEQVGHTRVL